MRRARVTVAYDGTEFHGFAETGAAGGQPVRTVMGDLRAAVERVVRCSIRPVGAGRTDAGVHGWGQVVSCDLPDDTDLADLQQRINKMLGPQIAVRDWRWTDDPTFHARYTALYRHYRYDVLNAPSSHPLLDRTTWHVPQPLDLWAMRLGADPLIGEHDFSSFCRRPRNSTAGAGREPSMVRRVLLADWKPVPGEVDGLLRFEIRATAFCHQMVRSIVGTLVEVGLGLRSAGDMRALLMARDRTVAGRVAPPQGLTLWHVGYPEELPR